MKITLVEWTTENQVAIGFMNGLIEIWKMDEKLERLLTHGPEDMSASPDCEYSPASPEYESVPASPVSSTKSPAKAWCYTFDDELDYCSCQRPWSPSINYKPCEMCGREQCECLRLPVKQAEID